jgi:signal transduction histidine kinase
MTTRRRGNRRAGRYPQLLRAVTDLTNAVRDGRDGTEILGQVCGHARALAGARTVTVMTAETDDTLLVRAAAGPVSDWPPGTRIASADTLAWSAVQGRRPVAEDPRRGRHRQEQRLAATGTRRVLYIPLPGHGSATGVLGVGYRDRRAPAREAAVLEPLAAVSALVPVVREAHCAARRADVEEQATVGERRRIARDLHDSVEQTLYGISLGADTATELLRRDPAQADRSIQWIQETAVAGLTALRGIILSLRPETLATDGLAPALVRLLETLQTLHGCHTVAELGPEPSISAATQQVLYSIAQEAVQNTAKHAHASRVTLRMVNHGPDVVLEVIDDGVGFAAYGEFPGRLGLRSMRERAAGAGGRLEIVSGLGIGTVVRAALPAED